MKIRNLTESLERNYLNEKVNWDNEEINALLRKYVGKKNIPAKAQKAIEDAGILVKKSDPDWGGDIYFENPSTGKKLVANGRTWKSGPMTPQDTWSRTNFSEYGTEDTRGWDLALNNNNPRMADRSAQLRKSWDAADLKGYLDSERPKSIGASERKAMVDSSYSPEASEYEEGDPNLRPHSDPYRHLKAKKQSAIKDRDWKRRYYNIKSDEEIEAEVQKFRDELIRKNNYSKSNNQDAEDAASNATAAVDQYLRDKGIREGLNEDVDPVFASVHEAIQNVMERACDNLAVEIGPYANGWDPDVDWDWEDDSAAAEWQRAFDSFVFATAKYFTNKRR